MKVKNSKLTLKSLQIELNLVKEELKINKEELKEMKEEFMNVKEQMKHPQEKENVENPNLNPVCEFSCKICDKSFGSQKKLKMHNQSNHTPLIKCELCDETFKKNCDQEILSQRNHFSVEMFECDKSGKQFVLKWRIRKH